MQANAPAEKAVEWRSIVSTTIARMLEVELELGFLVSVASMSSFGAREDSVCCFSPSPAERQLPPLT